VRQIPKGYLPTLDGWRAVAILAVLVNHDKIHRIGPISLEQVHWQGKLGVNLFFAISGILICTRLLDEERVSGTINLKSFYIRRLFRIQPAAVAYLVAIALLMAARVLDRAPQEVLDAALMVRNYLPLRAGPHAWYTAHFWSLAVEEHFYLFLPGFLVLVRKHRIAILCTIVVLLETWRTVVFNQPRLQFGLDPEFRTDMAVGGILLASLLALLLRQSVVRAWLQRWARPWVIVLVFVAVGVWVGAQKGAFSDFALQCSFALLVVSTLLRPQSMMGWILEIAPMRFIGRISYSLYVWQMLFFPFWAYVSPPHSKLLMAIQNSGWRYVALIVVSLISYFSIEKPMVRIGHRLAKSPVPARGEFAGS
jgi:peptidoglycan/LPS O-acetylase OafA/YrhL